MPTYEFRCPSGHEFENFYRSIGAAPTVVACPVCGKTAERQLSAGAGLVFKGSGFYITDYGKDGKKDQTKPTATKDSSSSSESSGKSDASAPAGGGSGSKSASESKPAPAPKPAEKPATKKAKDSE
jgi:putative FmdB family regulatory protein